MSDTPSITTNGNTLPSDAAGLPTDTQHPDLEMLTTAAADGLPTVAECRTHLRLLSAFVHLREAVDRRGRDEGLLADGEAWELFCRAAVARFFAWAETVDARGGAQAHLPMPPIDVLVVWHAFLLNPGAYRTYADVELDGRLGGKGLDWDALVSRCTPLSLSPSRVLSPRTQSA